MSARAIRKPLGKAAVTEDLARLLSRALEDGEEVLSIEARSGVSERKIHSILRCEYRTTKLETADMVLVAIGETTALLSGEVRLVDDGRRRAAPVEPAPDGQAPVVPEPAATVSAPDIATEPAVDAVVRTSSAPKRLKPRDLIALGLLRAGEKLYFRYKGAIQSAELLADGNVRLADGRVFRSLSAAAEAAKGSQADSGWNSWRVERGGLLVQLLEIRRQAPGSEAEGCRRGLARI